MEKLNRRDWMKKTSSLVLALIPNGFITRQRETSFNLPRQFYALMLRDRTFIDLIQNEESGGIFYGYSCPYEGTKTNVRLEAVVHARNIKEGLVYGFSVNLAVMPEFKTEPALDVYYETFGSKPVNVNGTLIEGFIATYREFKLSTGRKNERYTESQEDRNKEAYAILRGCILQDIAGL